MATVDKEKVFEFYTYFPPEVQMMIIEEMCADDRCRFRRCSKLSDKQARSSKKYIYGLEIRCDYSDDSIYIGVAFNNFEIDKRARGFQLNFQKEEEKNILRYLDFSKRKEHWRMEMCPSTDMTHLAVQMFRLLLKVSQHSIKILFIREKHVWEKLINLGFVIEKLRNLEEICGSEIDVKPLFSLLQRPLKNLIVECLGNDENPSNCEEIYRVQNILEMSSLKLNYEQFLRLKASHIEINIGYLTEKDIINFIKSWQNGLVRETLTCCLWNLGESNFDVNQVFSCFEENTHSRLGSKDVWIKSKKYSSKSAELSYDKTWCSLSIRNC